MKIFMTMKVEEILNQIDPSAIREYVKNQGIYIDQDRDSEQLWEDLELQLEKESKEIAIFVEDRVDSIDLLKRIDKEIILEHFKDDSQYYISEDIGELMEQIRVSGCIDEVVAFNNWKVSYKEVQGGFFCCLSLKIDNEWIEKWDGAQITEFESIKGGISSAFKRAASSGWGIGRYLYDVRNQWYPIRKSGKSYDFTINPTIDSDPPQNNTTTQEEQPKDKAAKARLLNITFGKHKGQNLGEIFDSDTRYIDYLIEKSQDQALVNACRYLQQKEG